HRCTGLFRQWHDALLATLPFHCEEAGITAGHCERQCHKLGDAQAAAIEKLKKGRQALRRKARGEARWCCVHLRFSPVPQALHLFLGKNLWERPPLLRRIEEPSRVVVAQSLGVKELEELADGGGFAGLRAGREVAITHVRDPLADAGRLRGSQATDVGEEI